MSLNPPEGVGTELAKLFSWVVKNSGCGACKADAEEWNRWGPDRCEEQREVILKRLRERAAKMNLPIRTMARTPTLGAVLTVAIKNARRKLPVVK